MAKNDDDAQQKKNPLLKWILFTVVGILAAGAGFAVPVFLFAGGAATEVNTKKNGMAYRTSDDLAVIPFDSVAVNLTSERLTRYLRVKVALVTEKSEQYELTSKIETQKPFLKSWLISYLANQTIADVAGSAGVNRIRREIQDQFNAMINPDGTESIRDILFEEFLVQ